MNGGAIAIGHPLGCSGARLAARSPASCRAGARYGVAALCVGVGQGLATVIENPAATGSSGRTRRAARSTRRGTPATPSMTWEWKL